MTATAATLRPERLAADPAGSVITVDRVSKEFRIPHQQVSTLKERVLHPFRASTHDVLHALRDVSFEIGEGEFFGIVGRNGSGKSTLLKCLSGIYGADAGQIAIDGRVSPFIELGVGFNPDLTARDNVLINAVMLGLSRREARERFDEIIEFAGLEEFIDLKLKNYSSGMSVRLAFSVAIQVDADIVIVDEVLAVGDAAFQQKCYEQFQRMKDEGRTIVFVTHDMGMVERFCDRAMLLERGRIVDLGDPLEVARQYNQLNFGHIAHVPVAAGEEGTEQRAGAGLAAEILDAWFENGASQRVVSLGHGEICRACYRVAVHEPLDNPIFAITLRNDAHHTILVLRTDWRHGRTGRFEAGQTVRVTFQFENVLAPSRYSLSPSVALEGSGEAGIDAREDMTSLVVHGTISSGGVVHIAHQVAVDPV